MISPGDDLAVSDSLTEPTAQFVVASADAMGEWFVCAGGRGPGTIPRWHSATFRVSQDAPHDLEWQLDIGRTATIAGAIVDSEGTPQAGARIACGFSARLQNSTRWRAFKETTGGAGTLDCLSDLDGHFGLAEVSTELSLTFSPVQAESRGPEYIWETDLPLATTVPGTFRAVESRTYSLLLKPDVACNVDVSVTGADGGPVANAIVAVMFERADGGSVWVDEARCVARRDGQWTFSPTPCLGTSAQTLWGRRFWVAAFAADGRAAFDQGVLQSRARPSLSFNNEPATISLRARAVDIETGEALPGCRLLLRHRMAPGRSLQSAMTEEDGWATMPAVVMPPEEWSRAHLETSEYFVIADEEQIKRTLSWLSDQGRPCPDSLRLGMAVSASLSPALALKK